MSLSASCPKCGNTLKAPNRLAGKPIRCLQCKTSFTLPAAGAATAVPPVRHPVPGVPSAGKQAVPGAVRAAFWLGLAAFALGLGAGVSGFFPATVGYARTLAWLGIVLGGGAVVLAIVREECGFRFPFAGSVASLLSLALVALWLGAAPGPGEDMGGRPPGAPGGPGQGPPPDWKGGPPREKGKGGPPPPAPPK